MKLFNRLSIKQRLTIFTTIGPVILVVLLIVNMWYLNNKSRVNAELETTYNLYNHVSELTKAGYQFMSDLSMNDDKIYMSIDNFNKGVQDEYSQAIQLMDSIHNFSIYQEDSLLLNNSVLLRAEVKEFYNLFQDLVLSYKEKGTATNNMVQSWDNIGDEIVELVVETEDVELMTQVIKLRKIEKTYLLVSQHELLFDLNGMLDNIREYIAFTYPNKVYGIENLSNQYIKYSEDIASINERIGLGSNEGIQQQLRASGSQLEVIISDLQVFNKQAYEAKEKKGIVFLVILYMLIVISLIALFILMGISFVDPIAFVADYLKKMSKGELPKKIKTTGKGDIFEVYEGLNELVDSLSQKKDFAIKLGNSELDAEYELLGKKDSFGRALVNLYTTQKQANEEHELRLAENKTRRFINEGLAMFGDIMRRHGNDMDQLAKLFIQELVKYLDAVQGGIFFVKTDDDKKTYLELKGAYAYNRQKYFEKKVLFGQGLVGTCAQERKPIMPKNLPNDYIEITSGLGDARPNRLIIFPVISEDSLEGVIEIASLKDIDGDKLEFLQQVAESLATALHGIKINAKTAELLKKSQQQAAEMAEQEEEMRQNMEELQATQEEATRREDELNAFVNSVNDAIPLLEVNKKGVILGANKLFAAIIDEDKKEALEGKEYADIFNLSNDPDKFQLFWDEIVRGDKQEEVTELSSPSRKEIYVKQLFQLVYNANDEVSKVNIFITDITKDKKKELLLESKEQALLRDKGEVDIMKGLFENTLARADFNGAGVLIKANKLYFKNMGLEQEQAEGINYSDLFNKAEIDRLNGIWESLHNRKHSMTSLFMRTKPDGEVVWLSSTFTPVFEGGEIKTVVFLANNITDNIKRLTR